MTKPNEPPYRVINANHWATIDTERDALVDEVERLRAEVDVLRRAALGEAAENDRLRRQVDSLVEAADAARLLLLFAAGPHEAGAVPAMLAAAIERAKGKKP